MHICKKAHILHVRTYFEATKFIYIYLKFILYLQILKSYADLIPEETNYIRETLDDIKPKQKAQQQIAGENLAHVSHLYTSVC